MTKKRAFPHGDYYKMPNALFGDKNRDGWISTIGPVGFLVYGRIARRYDHRRGRGLYESRRSMAKALGISTTTLTKHLNHLCRVGLVEPMKEGERRHPVWTYVPRLPVPDPPGDETTEARFVSANDTKKEGLYQMSDEFVSNGEHGGQGEPTQTKGDKPCFGAANRFIKRLYSMSPENQVTYVVEHLEEIPLKNQTQVAWIYWCSRWEEHYQARSYGSTGNGTSKAIARDKKNLRDAIRRVGFPELARRMDRCFAICDKTYPCFTNREWVRPITLGDFVSHHLFDRWVGPPSERRDAGPRSVEERIRMVREERATYASDENEREVDERCGEDSKPYRPTSAGNENSSDK